MEPLECVRYHVGFCLKWYVYRNSDRIRFQSVSIQRRLGVGTQIGAEEWSHSDLLTGQPFDSEDRFSGMGFEE